MPIIFVAMLLCSCSPKHTETDTQLPRYSDMSAAEDAMDAGKVK